MTRLLEHQSLDLVGAAGLRVAPYRVADSPAAATAAAQALGGDTVVKALVPVGRRGKAGAVRRARSAEEAGDAAGALLGSRVGQFPVQQVLVQAAVDIRDEYFVAFTYDSGTRGPVVLFSRAGGIDIEDLVRERPEALTVHPLEPGRPLEGGVAREVAEAGGLAGERAEAAAQALAGLHRVFEDDAFLVEVNPLAVDAAGALVVPSAVVVLDDQAEFRHPEWSAFADVGGDGGRPRTDLERRMREIDATDPGSAIRFNEFPEGRIACMLTGGGSGLVCLDHLQRLGEMPATTFDITPGRVEEKMYLATKAILGRPGLQGFIAGGNITNFIPIDVKVRGVVRALKELGVDARRFPVVFRYAGPGVEVARELAAEVPGIDFYDERTSLEDAVERIVTRVRAGA